MIQIEGSLYQISKLSSSASYRIMDCEPNILAFYIFFYSYLCEFHFVLRAIDNSLARVKLYQYSIWIVNSSIFSSKRMGNECKHLNWILSFLWCLSWISDSAPWNGVNMNEWSFIYTQSLYECINFFFFFFCVCDDS